MIDQRLAKLQRLQGEADAIRNELGISPAGAVIYQSCLNEVDEEMVIVEADGFGAATTRVVVGNYPLDYLSTFERSFETEKDAQAAADAIVEGTISLDSA